MASYNSIETVALFQKACDQQMIEGATSGWMEENAGQVKYEGGRDVKIPTISTSGLGDYDRGEGYKKGKVSLTYQTKTMEQDRGISFLLDRIEVDESGFIANATATMSIFQTENVIPEIDAYRYSKLCASIVGKGNSSAYTPDASTIFSQIKDDIAKVRDVAGAAEFVIIMSYLVADKLASCKEYSRYVNISQFKQGNLNTDVQTLNGIPVIRVPSARMKTAYTFKDGTSEFGFAPTAEAKDINWIICPRRAPIAVSKTDGVKIFDPQTTQGADGWTIEYRKVHDLWVPDNKLAAMRASISE